MKQSPKEPKLTRKQKAFADTLIANPKLSATKAALVTYGKPDKPINYNTAHSIASETIQKPAVLWYMEKHADKAQMKVIKLIDSRNEQIALAASKDTLDRVVGRPQSNTSLTQIGSISITLGKPQTP